MGSVMDEEQPKPSAERIAMLRQKTIDLASALAGTPIAELEILLEDLRESDGGRPMSVAIIERAILKNRSGK